jgi:tetratricopeptide (TPR) repeat protein
MFRKNYFTFLLSIALLLVGASAALAQTGPVRGRVEIKKADGTVVPAALVTIDVFRMDQKAKFPSAKTDKKGYFAFAGLPYGAKYALSISREGISPLVYPNVIAGAENVAITVFEGDGKRFTEDEVRSLLAGTSTNNTDVAQPKEPTAEEKKAQEEAAKKAAEIGAKNENTKQKNTAVNTALQEGIKAFDAQNFDLAITKFDEGYKANPEFIGSAPVLLNNKAIALMKRGVANYNKNSKLEDVSARLAEMSKVTKDFGDAIDAYNQSLTIIKGASPTAQGIDMKALDATKMQAMLGVIDITKYMVTTEKVDTAKSPVIKTLIGEYITIEPDSAKKLSAQISLADIYRIAGDSDNAVIEYRKALEMSPDNPDALAGLGLSLFNAGEINNNVAQKQEGLGYMERFAQVAPDNHKLKASVADAVAYLKSQKVTSTKVTTTKKKN